MIPGLSGRPGGFAPAPSGPVVDFTELGVVEGWEGIADVINIMVGVYKKPEREESARILKGGL